MKLAKKILTRMNITIAIIVLELLFFTEMFYRFLNYLPAIAAVSYLLSIVIILHLVKKDEVSAYKVSWLIVVMALPVAGGILYLIFRRNLSSRKLRERTQIEHDLIAGHLAQDVDMPADKRMASCLGYIQNASSYPVCRNTATKYYPFGELMFEDMLAELRAAEKFIFMEFFIYAKGAMWDQILEVLISKAEEGVDVRIIYDDMGSHSLFTLPYLRGLKSTKIKIVTFNPFVPLVSLVMNNRDHRKIMVIDGHTAFNGGINIADEYIGVDQRLGVWKDTGVRLKGDAVWSFTLMFAETWNVFCWPSEHIDDYEAYKNSVQKEIASDGYVQPFADSPLDEEQIGETVYIEILNQATYYVYIFTPYLIISDKMLYALQMAAKRGVDVRICTPGVPDKKIVYRMTRSYYKNLLEAGVKIYEYTPGFLHGKIFVSDDKTAVVGTINLDYRSLYLHFECATLLYQTSSIPSIRCDAVKTMADCREIAIYDCRKSFGGELLDSILHLFTPLM